MGDPWWKIPLFSPLKKGGEKDFTTFQKTELLQKKKPGFHNPGFFFFGAKGILIFFGVIGYTIEKT